MISINKVLGNKTAENEFILHMGIEFIEVRPGYAYCEMAVQPWHANPVGSLSGGAIFTLADTVSGAAASAYGTLVTTVSGNLNYLNPGIGVKKISAVATEVKHGKTMSVYDVEVFSEQEVLLSKGTFTFYHLKEA